VTITLPHLASSTQVQLHLPSARRLPRSTRASRAQPALWRAHRPAASADRTGTRHPWRGTPKLHSSNAQHHARPHPPCRVPGREQPSFCLALTARTQPLVCLQPASPAHLTGRVSRALWIPGTLTDLLVSEMTSPTSPDSREKQQGQLHCTIRAQSSSSPEEDCRS